MKLILFIILFIVIPTHTFCQLEVGIGGGISISHYKKNKDRDLSSEPISINGLEFLVFSNLPLIDCLDLQVEANFLQKGGKIGLLETKINNLGLNITPLYLLKVKGVQFYGGGGIFAGYAIKHSNTTISITNKNTNYKFDWGIIAKAGVALSLKKGKLFFQGKYHHSFDNSKKLILGNLNDPLSIASYKNRAWSINIGYQVPVSK